MFISYLSTLVIINKTVIFFKFNCQLQFCLTTLGQCTVLVSKQYIIAALTQTFPFNLVVILLSPTIPTLVTIQSILPAPSSFSAHILYCQFFFLMIHGPSSLPLLPAASSFHLHQSHSTEHPLPHPCTQGSEVLMNVTLLPAHLTSVSQFSRTLAISSATSYIATCPIKKPFYVLFLENVLQF